MSSAFSEKFVKLKIPLEDVKSATDGFSDKNLIGQNAIRKAYKGKLVRSEQQIDNIVAEKLVGDDQQKNILLQRQISTLCVLNHDNLVSVVGFCDEENEKVIIYKDEANGSLAEHLEDKSLRWMQRLEICLGVARALQYIHYQEERSFSLIHLNIQSSQILLDDNWIPKLSGFEYSMIVRTAQRNRIHLSKLRGTKGYVDQEYENTGVVTHKTDVYSFGVVLLEVLCGRSAYIPPSYRELRKMVHIPVNSLIVGEQLRPDEELLAPLAMFHYKEDSLQDIIHPSLWEQMDQESFKIFSETADGCLKENRAERLHIDQIVSKLENALFLQTEHENSLLSKKKSGVDAVAEGISTDQSKLINTNTVSSAFSEKFVELKIPLKDIKSATDGFSVKNLIGQSAIRKAYKGKLVLSEQQIDIVAEKLVGDDKQKDKMLQWQISTLDILKHDNLVSVVGFCDEENEKIIIYKREANGSLAEHLEDKSLRWIQRLKICLGIALALQHIHYKEDRSFSLIHLNIQSSQILLDDNWIPKLSGFEYSKMVRATRRNRLQLSKFRGTKGYIDQKYENTGLVTHKTDVYSFGVVLFEVLCGRSAYIPPWLPAKKQVKEEPVPVDAVGKLDQMVEHDDGSGQLTKQQHSTQELEKMDEIIQENVGGSSELTKQHSPILKESLDDDSIKHEGVSSHDQLAKHKSAEKSVVDVVKQHWNEERSPEVLATEGSLVGKLYEVVDGEGRSPHESVVRNSLEDESPDVVKKMDEMDGYERVSRQLTKQHSVVEALQTVTREMDETADHVGHPPLLATRQPGVTKQTKQDINHETSEDFHIAPGDDQINKLITSGNSPMRPTSSGEVDQNIRDETSEDFHMMPDHNQINKLKISGNSPMRSTLSGEVDQGMKAETSKDFHMTSGHDQINKLKTSDNSHMQSMSSREVDRDMKEETSEDFHMKSGYDQINKLKTSGNSHMRSTSSREVDQDMKDETSEDFHMKSGYDQINKLKTSGNSHMGSTSSREVDQDMKDETSKDFHMKSRYNQINKLKTSSNSRMQPQSLSEILRDVRDETLNDFHMTLGDDQISGNYLSPPPSQGVRRLILSYAELQQMRQESPYDYPMFPPSFGDIVPREHSSEFFQKPPSFGDLANNRPSSLVQYSGKQLRPDKELLAPLAMFHYKEDSLQDIIHPSLWEQMDQESFKIFSKTADGCLKEKRAERLHIDQIVSELMNALALQTEHENSLLSKKKSEVNAEAEGTSTNQSKWKGVKHLIKKYDDIKVATEEFLETNCIGEGAFGKVYKATLDHFDSRISWAHGRRSGVRKIHISSANRKSKNVAVKRLFQRKIQQAYASFTAEINTLSICYHPNIVSLLGFCDEDSNMILVYELVPNRTLGHHLESENIKFYLKWASRLQICLDIAEAIKHLHTEKNIIHRDIKSDNVLLDENYRAKLGDFGLSLILPKGEGSIPNISVVGTSGYVDPEYESSFVVQKASDIYSLGVILLEVVSGLDPEGLAHFAREWYSKKGTLTSIVDQRLMEEVDEENFTLSKGANQDSLRMFLDVACRCVNETQVGRPNILQVISVIKDAQKLQANDKDKLMFSFEDIKLSTEIFDHLIGTGGSGSVYKGQVKNANQRNSIAVKRVRAKDEEQEEILFMTELEVLQDYSHDSIIGLVGYCTEYNEKIIVFDYAFNRSLDRHLKNYDLTWLKRLRICVNIAEGLKFLHEPSSDKQEVVIHTNIKSRNILLTEDWEAKICDLGKSLIIPKNNYAEMDIPISHGTKYYSDPQYPESSRFLTADYDIYSLGVVLIEILCGILVDDYFEFGILTDLCKYDYKQTVYYIAFEGIRGQIHPESLNKFLEIAHRCLDHAREPRPKAQDVLEELTKALEVQEEYDIWKPKLPSDYDKIFKMSKYYADYSTLRAEDLYRMLCKGILLQRNKVFFTLGDNGDQRNEVISACKFLHKERRQSIPKSRFPKVVEMANASKLNIGIKIRPILLVRGVEYSVHLVFKFSGPRRSKAKGMYVNLKYKMGGKTLHAYFATWREDEWMMVELCRFSDYNDDTPFEFLLESFSRSYCGSRPVYIEGIEFRAIENVKHEETENLKEVQQVVESNVNRDQLEQVCTVEKLVIWRFKKSYERTKLLKEIKVDKTEVYLLSAKDALYESTDVKLFNSNPSAQTRFQENFEFPSHQTVRIKCKIESQRLTVDTEYACYLVFKLSEKCRGLHCPVVVWDLLNKRKNRKKEVVYFRTPSPSNVNDAIQVPKEREDGWAEVNVWQFNSTKEVRDNFVPIKLKMISYEGNMSGLIVSGLEFRPL